MAKNCDFNVEFTESRDTFPTSFGELFNVTGGVMVELKPATEETLGGIIVGDNLSIQENGKLSVDTAEKVEAGDKRPVTADGVYRVIGNIEHLLKEI